MLRSTLFLGLFCLLITDPPNAKAAQPGRITSEVNFRKGPSTAERVIGRLRGGEEVEVLKLDPAGWYFVIYQGRPGYVYKGYIKLAGNRASDSQRHRRLARQAGMILVGIGIVLIASVLAPEILAIATALAVAIGSAAVCDFLFELGLLYSFFFVSVGAFALFLFFKRKTKDRTVPREEIPLRKAA